MRSKPKPVAEHKIANLRVTRESWLKARVYTAAHPEMTIGGFVSEAIHFYVDHLAKRSKVAIATSRG